jgi:cytochrome c556
MLRVKFITGLFFVFSVLLVSSQLFAQADVIEKRQKAMKGNSEDVKAIKAAVEAKDYATVEAKAKDIMGTAEKIPSLFPKGSTAGKTKAKPEIWEKPDDFSKGAKNLAKASGDLAAAAKTGNADDVNVKLKALGDACGSCHKAFRAEKYSE